MTSTNCAFERLSSQQIRCAVCGFTRDWQRQDALPKQLCRALLRRPAAVPARSGPCLHRGPEFRLAECPTCQGNVRVKVFPCALHGECTIAKAVPGLRVCELCPDHSPPPAPQSTMLLSFAHGLGDNVQFTAVLRHLQRLRPDLIVDVACYPRCVSLFAGLCRAVFPIGGQPADGPYDLTHYVAWHEPNASYADSPSTKIERHLREVHNVTPRVDLCDYRATPGPEHIEAAHEYLASVCGQRMERYPVALVHYQGSSFTRNKNLRDADVLPTIRALLAQGVTPIVLDWKSLPRDAVLLPGVVHRGADEGNIDAMELVALASLARLTVGIDSGPGHVFGCVDTPALIVWTGHHPVHYYGTSANVLHLVPADHARLIRGEAVAGLAYFERHYRHRVYRDLAVELAAAALDAIGPDVPAWLNRAGPCRVSVVVPMFRSAAQIRRQIATWEIQPDTEVIYVDDGCPQRSWQAVVDAWSARRAEIPHGIGRIVRLPVNGGHPVAANAGAREARGDYLVFLNADCRITTGWLAPLIARLESDVRIGMAGCLILRPDGRVNSSGSRWDGRDFSHIETAGLAGEREMTTGAAVVMRRGDFEYLGGFDEGFKVGYFEDSDLCMRLRAAGKTIWHEPASVVYHEGGHSGAAGHPYREANQERFRRRWVTSRVLDQWVGRRQCPPPVALTIRRTGARGDVLAAAAVCAALKARGPQCRLTFATATPDVLTGHPWIDRTIPAAGPPDGGLIDLDGCYESRPWVPLLTAFAEAAGVRPEDCRLAIGREPIDLPAGPYAVLHAGAFPGWVGRANKESFWNAVAAGLIARGLAVLAVGGSGDKLPAGCRDLRGRTSPAQLATLMAGARLFAGSDSFPFWVAQAVGTPGTVYFGCVRPELRIVSSGIVGVTADGLPCLGCHHRGPRPNLCTAVCEAGHEHCQRLVAADKFLAVCDQIMEAQCTPA